MRAGPLLRRTLLVAVLLAVLFGTLVAYGSVGPAPERNVYPDQRDLAADYDRYVGDRVVVSGEVVSTDPLVVAGAERRRVLGLLSLGAVSHLAADALLLTATGYSKPMWWPVAHVGLPTPGLYLSTEPTPLFVAGAVAAVLWAVRRRRARPE
jgi:hypothetical protein